FDTYRYRLEIIGHYVQLGEFLSDIASLPRIIVPQDVILKGAAGQAQKLLGDTLGALLEAQFGIRTFVKAAAPPPAPAKKGAGGGRRARDSRRASWRCSQRVRSPPRRSPTPRRRRNPTAPSATASWRRCWCARSSHTRAAGGTRSCRCSGRATSGRSCRTCGSWASTTTGGLRRAASRCCAM